MSAHNLRQPSTNSVIISIRTFGTSLSEPRSPHSSCLINTYAFSLNNSRNFEYFAQTGTSNVLN